LGVVPTDYADAYLVERDGNWFCPSRPDFAKKCPTGLNSQAFVERFVADAEDAQRVNQKGRPYPTLMKVAKARKICAVGSQCDTAVPEPMAGCSNAEEKKSSAIASPYCALVRLGDLSIGRGVVIGAAKIEDGEDDARPITDIAHQACEINRASIKAAPRQSRRLYDFIFLDRAPELSASKLKELVSRITHGRVGKNGKQRCRLNGKKSKKTGGLKVITNDNGASRRQLDNEAWGHAMGLNALKVPKDETRLANSDGLSARNRQFVKRVNRLSRPGRRTRAILRPEVPPGTDALANLKRRTQCKLLKALARRQDRLGFTFEYPLYVHATGDLEPYDSIERDTYDLQLSLMRRWSEPNRKKAAAPSC